MRKPTRACLDLACSAALGFCTWAVCFHANPVTVTALVATVAGFATYVQLTRTPPQETDR